MNQFPHSSNNFQSLNPRPITKSIENNANQQKENLNEKNEDDLNQALFGTKNTEKMIILTGTVERVMKWYKIFQNHTCFYEVIASIISIQNGNINCQRIMLMKDRKGPVMQVIYYSIGTHIDIEDFHIGQVLRCVGRMTSPNSLTAISIRTATKGEIDTLPRLCSIGDHAVSSFCKQ